jgi:hypothetical protein
MPLVNLPNIRNDAASDQQNIQYLTDAYYKLRKELAFLLGNLDRDNVVEAQSVVADWVYAGNIVTDQIVAGEAKISVALIEDLIVGGNVAMGPYAAISWGQVTDADTYSLAAWTASGYATHMDANGIYTGTVAANKILIGGENGSISFVNLSDKPFIPDDAYITTITKDTITTAYINALEITVKAANISGVLTADQITTNIAQVNSTLQLGSTVGTGRTIIFGSNASIANPVNTENLTISAFYRIDLDAQNGAYVNNSKIATESWVSDNFASDVHSHSYVTFSALNTEINKAMTSHLNMYHAT